MVEAEIMGGLSGIVVVSQGDLRGEMLGKWVERQW